MAKSLHFPTSLTILLIFICLVPMSAFSADSDRQLLEEWVERENFSDLSIEDRLVLLAELSRQNSGEDIFVASMGAFKKEVDVRICEIGMRKRDLKSFLESLNIKKLTFHVSENVKITSDMVFKNCTLLSLVEGLCNKYQLKAFYYAREVYLLPSAMANID